MSAIVAGEAARQGQRPTPAEIELASAKREYRFLRTLLIVSLWIGSALALSLNLADGDLWGHVRNGQDWVADKNLHRTTAHNLAAEGSRWIDHENLAELLFIFTFNTLGSAGLLVGKCLLGLGLLGSMAWAGFRRGVRPLVMAAFLLLVANNLAAFFPLRPQALSFLGMALMLAVLERAFTGWQNALHGEEGAGDGPWAPRRLWWLLWLVPLFLFWTNAHTGFAAGLVILAAYLGGRIIEVFTHHRERGTRVAALLAVLGILPLLISFVNPYGYKLHAWILTSLGEPRPDIAEWAPPSLAHHSLWPMVALIVLSIVAWSVTQKRRDWVQIAILALVAWQACLHLRHIALLALLCGFWIPCHLQSVLQRVRPSLAAPLPVMRIGPWMRWGLAALLIAAIGLQSLALCGRLSQRLPETGIMHPVDGLRSMHDGQLAEWRVVSCNRSPYAVADLAPQVRASFDSRYDTCYPQQLVDKNYDSLRGEQLGKRFQPSESGLVDPYQQGFYGEPNLLLVDRGYVEPIEVIEDISKGAESESILLYQDKIAQLWGRHTMDADFAAPRYLPAWQRPADEQIATPQPPWFHFSHPPFPATIAGHDRANSPIEGP